MLLNLEPIIIGYNNYHRFWLSAVIHSCSFFLEFGDVYMWGWNETGQLGLPCQNIQEATSRYGKTHTQVLIADIFKGICYGNDVTSTW